MIVSSEAWVQSHETVPGQAPQRAKRRPRRHEPRAVAGDGDSLADLVYADDAPRVSHTRRHLLVVDLPEDTYDQALIQIETRLMLPPDVNGAGDLSVPVEVDAEASNAQPAVHERTVAAEEHPVRIRAAQRTVTRGKNLAAQEA
jgi:hypothetical protein